VPGLADSASFVSLWLAIGLQAVIMVIDSSERERVTTVKDELNTLLSHEVSTPTSWGHLSISGILSRAPCSEQQRRRRTCATRRCASSRTSKT
jgi:hypothetical protein